MFLKKTHAIPINKNMRIHEIILEKASVKTCRKGDAGKNIGISAASSCKAQGLMTRDSDTTDGTGKQGVKGSGRPVKGKYVKNEKYGGRLKNYGSNK